MRVPQCGLGVAALAAALLTVQPMSARTTATAIGVPQADGQLPPAPAGLRVPPWRPPQRSGAAPTPVVLGTAPETTTSATRQAAVDRALADGGKVAMVIDEPQSGELAVGYTPIAGWASDLELNGPGIDVNNVQVWLGGAEGQPLGLAQVGWERPDLAPRSDNSPFAYVGFRLGWQTCGFPVGTHRVVVYSWRQDSAAYASADTEVVIRPCVAESGTVLFADPLDGANPWGRDWTTGGDAACALRYDRGEYHVLKLGPLAAEDCGASDVERTVYGDIVLDLDVRLVEPAVEAFASVGLRQDVEQFSTRYLTGYAVHVNPMQGTIALVRDLGHTYTVLAEARPPALHPGAASNHLTIQAEGPHFRVAVNGQAALDARDERLAWGAITLGAGAPEDQGAEAAFQNLVVRRP